MGELSKNLGDMGILGKKAGYDKESDWKLHGIKAPEFNVAATNYQFHCAVLVEI